MKHILEELRDLEQKRKFMMSELIEELVHIKPVEFEDYELTNKVGIALEDSWYKRQDGYVIDYSLSCDGAYFDKEDTLYQDGDYTLVYAEVYDDAVRYADLILLSTKNFKEK